MRGLFIGGAICFMSVVLQVSAKYSPQAIMLPGQSEPVSLYKTSTVVKPDGTSMHVLKFLTGGKPMELLDGSMLDVQNTTIQHTLNIKQSDNAAQARTKAFPLYRLDCETENELTL